MSNLFADSVEALAGTRLQPSLVWIRLAEIIRRHFKIGYHHDHVGRFLRRRLGWTPQKPRRRARERDEAAILDWQSQEFPRIAREA